MGDKFTQYRALIRRCGVGAALVVVFFLYSLLIPFSFQGSSVRLNAPDEMANYFFAKHLAQSGEIGLAVPWSVETSGHLHPRSATIIDGRMLPVGFLGLVVLYGGMAALFGIWVLPFITPCLAVLGGVAWYWLLRRVFSPVVAMTSAGLLLLHPAYWYNAARGFLPNVPFVSMLMIGLALWSVPRRRAGWVWWILGGLFVGLALTVRLSELPWVIGALLIVGTALMRNWRVHWLRGIMGLISMVIPVLAMLWLNNTIYHDPLVGGYQTGGVPALQQASTVAKSIAGADFWSHMSIVSLRESGAQLVAALLPFGIHPDVLWANFLVYGVKFFMPWTICALIGGLLVLRWIASADAIYIRNRSGGLIYLIISLGVSAWLVLFYGSWVFYDNISKGVTLGASYIRYWLPMFILTTPLIASGLVAVIQHRKGKKLRRFLMSLIVLAVAVCSGLVTISSPHEGLWAVSRALIGYQAKFQQIQAVTPANAIIVSARSDKIFFPERTAATDFEPFQELPLVAPIALVQPLYYYGAWPVGDIAYINRRFFEQYHLALQSVASLGDGEALYRVVPTP